MTRDELARMRLWVAMMDILGYYFVSVRVSDDLCLLHYESLN